MEKAIRRARLRVPARASAFYFTANAAAKAVGLATTPIFTRILSGDGYGEYTLYMSCLGFASVLVSSLTTGVHSLAALRESEEKKEEYTCALLGVGVSFSLLICILLFALSPFLGLNRDLFILMSIQLTCDTAVAIYCMRERYSYRYYSVCAVSVAQSLLSPTLAILLIRGAHLGYLGRIYALLIASLTVATPAFKALASRGGRLYDRDLWRGIASRSAPLIPYALTSALSLQTDRLVISRTMGRAALASYSVAHALGAAVSVVCSALLSSLSPWIIRRLSCGDIRRVRDVGGECIYVIGALSVIPAALAPELMSLLAPTAYSEAIPAVFPIALSTLPAFSAAFCSVGLISRGDGGRVSAYSITASVITVVSAIILTRVLGYLGAGCALLAGQTVAAIMATRALRESDAREMLPTRECASVYTAAAVLCLLSFMLRESLAARGAVLVAVLAIVAWRALPLYRMVREREN